MKRKFAHAQTGEEGEKEKNITVKCLNYNRPLSKIELTLLFFFLLLRIFGKHKIDMELRLYKDFRQHHRRRRRLRVSLLTLELDPVCMSRRRRINLIFIKKKERMKLLIESRIDE